MKSEYFKDYAIGYNKSLIAKNEDNDCVVCAIAVTFGLDYDVSHKFVKNEFGRKDKEGTYAFREQLTRRNNIEGINYTVIPTTDLTYPGSARHQINGGNPVAITLRIFLSKFLKGRFLVIVSQHAFSIIDGVVIGNANDVKCLKKKIRCAIKIVD